MRPKNLIMQLFMEVVIYWQKKYREKACPENPASLLAQGADTGSPGSYTADIFAPRLGGNHLVIILGIPINI